MYFLCNSNHRMCVVIFHLFVHCGKKKHASLQHCITFLSRTQRSQTHTPTNEATKHVLVTGTCTSKKTWQVNFLQLCHFPCSWQHVWMLLKTMLSYSHNSIRWTMLALPPMCTANCEMGERLANKIIFKSEFDDFLQALAISKIQTYYFFFHSLYFVKNKQFKYDLNSTTAKFNKYVSKPK